MFRKSAEALARISKSMPVSSLKSVTPIVSVQQPFSSYVTPDRGWFHQSLHTIKNGAKSPLI